MSLTDAETFDLKRDYVYVPAFLLIVGTFIVKRDWTIYAAVLAIAFGAYNLYALRKSSKHCSFKPCLRRQLANDCRRHVEIKKVLKPDVFQEFELEEKTLISHNVAM